MQSTSLYFKALSLCDFKDIKVQVPIQNAQITSIEVIDQNFVPKDGLKIAVGTSDSKLYIQSRSMLNSGFSLVHAPREGGKDAPEGSVQEIKHAFGMVAWCTDLQVYAYHYKLDKKLCKIQAPSSNQTLKVRPRFYMSENGTDP